MCLLTREDLPVLDQLLPDDFSHDLHADAQQLGDWGVRVVEAVQQDLGHLSLLLPYQPPDDRSEISEDLSLSLPFSLFIQDFTNQLMSVPEKDAFEIVHLKA